MQFTSDDRTFIESVPYFFLATADADGRPDCSYKGGMPGFVRLTGPSELAFPDYDGNGMFKSLGNILVNPTVGILFIAMHGKPQRLQVNGEATVSDQDPLLAQTVGAQLIVRVAARATFPNCPRYIPTMQLIEPSKYTPQPGCRGAPRRLEGFRGFQELRAPVPTDLQRLMKSESIQSVLRLRHDAPQRRRAYPLARVPGLGLATAGRFSLTREPACSVFPRTHDSVPKGEG